MLSKKLFIPLLLMILSSCYEIQVLPKDSAPIHAPRKMTVWTYAWGIETSKNLKSTEFTNCQGNGFSSLKVTTNFGDVLMAVLTLGFAFPMQVTWDCAKDSQPAGLEPIKPKPN